MRNIEKTFLLMGFGLIVGCSGAPVATHSAPATTPRPTAAETKALEASAISSTSAPAAGPAQTAAPAMAPQAAAASAAVGAPPTFNEDPLDGVWTLQKVECIGVKMPAALKKWNAQIQNGQFKQVFRKAEARVTIDIKKVSDLKKPATYCRGFRYEDWEIRGKEKLMVTNSTSYERGVGGDKCWSSNKDPEAREYSFLMTKEGFKFNLWKNALCAGHPTILVYKKVF